MAYIGQGIKQGTFKVLDTSGNTYNGSNVTFSLGTQVGSAAQLLVSHDGVIQLPGTDYTLASGGASITFSTAPASGASIFIVEISGAVGGTVTPSDNSVGITQLNVSDGSSGQALTTNGSGTLSFASVGLAGIDDQSSSNDDQLTITDTAVVINEDSDDVDFRVESNGNANMLFVSGGNDVVGIGNEGDLGVGLHIKSADSGASVGGAADELVVEGSGNSGMSILSGTSHIGGIYFGDSGDVDIGKLEYDHSDNSMRFTTNDTEQMRIANSGGDLLVNRTSNNSSYSGKVSVLEGSNNISILAENSLTSGAGTSILKSLAAQNTENASYNLIDGHAPSGRFLVRDSSAVQNTDNSYGSISDERIKQDITDANSQWDDIKALKIRNFKLKSKPSKAQIGVVAQELETAGMNGLVEDAPPEKEDVALHSDFGSIDGEDNFTPGQRKKTVKYSVLYMKAIKALQEAMTRIETLEAKVKTLEEG